MVAVVTLYGAVATVIVIMSLWPHYHNAIGAWQLVSRKKKKESVQVENKLVQGVWQHNACSCEGQGNAVRTAVRAQ